MNNASGRVAITSSQVSINGSALHRARLVKGLSQRELAKECAQLGHRVSDGEISKYERGLRTPRPANLKTLADALGVQVADLLHATPEP